MKKKILRIILFVILAIVLIVLIRFCYNFRFYQKLISVTTDLYESGNYTCYYYNRGMKLDTETGNWQESYSKMGVKVKDDKCVYNNFYGSDKDYALCGNSYYDINNKNDCIYVNFEENTFQVQPNVIPIEFHMKLINYPIYEFNEHFTSAATLADKVYFAVANYFPAIVNIKLRNATEYGKDYIIMIEGDRKTYINKDTLLVEKEVVNEYGKDVVEVIYEIEAGNVTDEDVNIPDLSKFKQEIW